MAITIPDIVPYLLASLGLLFLWQLHSLQVRAGRIKAVDIWNRSGIRLFLHVTPEDSHACAACREVNNTAFLPKVVASMKFGPLTKPCTTPPRFPMPDGGASWVLARSIAFARAAHEAARKGLLVQQGDDTTTGRSPGQHYDERSDLDRRPG